MRDKTAKQICEIFDIAPVTLNKWIAKGVPHDRGAKGKGNTSKFEENEVAYWLRENNMTTSAGRPKGPAANDLAAAKLRKENAMADLKEIERDQLKGLLVLKSEVENANIKKFATIRSKLMALPSTAVPLMQGLPEQKAFEVLEDHIREALTELSRQ